MHPSSKKDTKSLVKKKVTFSDDLEKKMTKTSQTHKRKTSPTVSVSDEHVTTTKISANTTATTVTANARSFVSQQDIESSIASRSSYSATEKNAEHKRALIEMKRLEKKQLEEQEQLQYQQKTDGNGDVDNYLDVPKIKYPYVTPGQVSGLDALERWQVSEKGLKLSADDETLSEDKIQRDLEVDEMLKRAKEVKAKEVKAKYSAELKEKERLQRKKVSVQCYINMLTACI